MAFLSGWKEIAEHLHLAVRTAQRWERLGLPVRRASSSARSPVIAISEDIEKWMRSRKRKVVGFDRSLVSNVAEFQATRRKTRKLVKQLKYLSIEQNKLLNLVCNNICQH